MKFFAILRYPLIVSFRRSLMETVRYLSDTKVSNEYSVGTNSYYIWSRRQAKTSNLMGDF